MHVDNIVAYCAPGIVFYLFDVVMRHSQQWYNRTIVSSAINAKLNADSSVVSLNILCEKTFNWVGSDIIFLYAPEISWWQWHPFTTTSAAIPACAVEGGPNNDVRVLQLQIKKYDRWTRDLINRLQNSAAPLTISLSGPYHGASRKWLNYDSLLFIGGGIGATPLLGILRDMIALRAAGVSFGGKDGLPRKVKFIWLCRNGEEFSILGRDILEEVSRPNSWLQIELCNTSKQDGKQVDGTVAVAVTPEASKREEDSIRSRIESNPLTSPYMGGHPFIYIFSLFLSLGGGIGGILLAYTYDANRDLYVEDRTDFSFIGMLQLACLMFGATIPPLVVMLIVRTINVLLAHRRRATTSLVVNDIQDKAVVYTETKDTVSRVSTNNMEDAYAKENGKSSKVTRLISTSILGFQMDRMSGLGQVMGGPLEALMSWGRPNFSNILKGFAEDAYSCEPNSDAGVFIGGPEPMVRAVMSEVTSLNSIFGSNTRAHLDAHPLTHSF
uniref:FAD-binding FR-type domain-containing protein n=1 Tax=Polytomella parva TaxID=51329 RepID=A0A7S0URN6_9CHLO